MRDTSAPHHEYSYILVGEFCILYGISQASADRLKVGTGQFLLKNELAGSIMLNTLKLVDKMIQYSMQQRIHTIKPPCYKGINQSLCRFYSQIFSDFGNRTEVEITK